MARVMIIDNTLEHVKILTNELKKNGHSTMGFLRGDKAIEAFKEFKPQLVLCEWQLTDKMKCWQLAHVFAKEKDRPYMVAIFRHPSALKKALSLEFGFDECSSKPLKVFTLLDWAGKNKY